MRVLGIDPALRMTGFGLIDWNGRELRLVTAGTIATDCERPTPQRLLQLQQAIGTLIADFKPDTAVLETVFAHYRHPATASLLGHARGVICSVCAAGQLPVTEYAATRVKMALTGKGHATKSQVQKTVVSLLGLATLPKYYDVTDALALAVAYCHMAKAGILKKNSWSTDDLPYTGKNRGKRG